MPCCQGSSWTSPCSWRRRSSSWKPCRGRSCTCQKRTSQQCRLSSGSTARWYRRWTKSPRRQLRLRPRPRPSAHSRSRPRSLPRSASTRPPPTAQRCGSSWHMPCCQGSSWTSPCSWRRRSSSWKPCRGRSCTCQKRTSQQCRLSSGSTALWYRRWTKSPQPDAFRLHAPASGAAGRSAHRRFPCPGIGRRRTSPQRPPHPAPSARWRARRRTAAAERRSLMIG